MTYGLYDVSTRELWDKRVTQAKANGFVWGTDFPEYEITYDIAKVMYHGNSKLILMLYNNDIINRDEIIVTTKAVLKSYPQHKGKVLEVL